MEKIALDQAVVNEAIVKAAIYPSIGIARVGNSLTGWYVGPEVPDPLPLPPGSYRDDAGALKREASRFYDPGRSIPRRIEDVPVAAQGDTLTKAALDFCLADAFHPGCEMTWPVRQITMYRAPFRFAHAPAGWVEPDYGMTLTYAIASAPNGCLGPQVPGGTSRWMAVPWQCDTASCRSGYEKTYDPYVPTFWPARVPNQVLTRQDYDIVMDTERPLAERQAAFARRADWDAPLDLKALLRHPDQQHDCATSTIWAWWKVGRVLPMATSLRSWRCRIAKSPSAAQCY